MQIAFGCDGSGVELKKALIAHAESLGHTAVDCGLFPDEVNDYPIYAIRAARKVQSGECQLGVVICGTGIGASIACNKVRGIRCALLSDCYSAKMTRAHNDANVAAFGARVMGIEHAKMMLEFFLATPFEGGRHARRIAQIADTENGKLIEEL